MKTLILLGCLLAALPAAAEIPEGQPVPKVSMKLLRDGAVSDFPGWQAYSGKVVILEFWGTWCAPCVQAIPHLNALKEELRGKPVEFISVTAEDAATIGRFLKNHPMTGLVAVDAGDAVKKLGTGQYPQTLIIGKTGKALCYTNPDSLSVKAIENLLATGSAEAFRCDLPSPEPRRGKEASSPASGRPLFEVKVASLPCEGRSNYGRRTTPDTLGLELGRLRPRSALAKAFEVPEQSVLLPAGLPEACFEFSATGPRTAESAIKGLLREAVKAAYGVEARLVSSERDVLLLRHDKAAPQPGLVPVTTINGSMSSGGGHFKAGSAGVAEIVRFLSDKKETLVLDESGLAGRFNVDLKWSVGTQGALEAALAEQLGLSLAPARRTVELLQVTIIPPAAAPGGAV